MQKRKRGVVLTHQGLQKFEEVRYKCEFQENFGKRFTLEDLSQRTSLDPLTIRKVLGGTKGVDKRTLEALFLAFGTHLCEDDYSIPDANRRQDWGAAMSISAFYGRTQELKTLDTWIMRDRCRVVALLGMGGVGKTCLSIRLAEQIQDKFDCLIWRSLCDAPPISTFLANLIQFFSDESETKIELPESISERISQLIDFLREMRCLIVLDSVDTVLREGDRAGHYHPGYEGYGELLERVGESGHQSCLLLTTREKPKEVASLEGEDLPVRTLRLAGLQDEEGVKILNDKKLKGTDDDLKALVRRYAGNALALRIVATTIQDLLAGQVAEFLQQETTVFGDIRNLLDQQFNRLSDLEKHLMYWLAINREPVMLPTLREDLATSVPQFNLLETLEWLGRRSLIEQDAACFTLQPVVMEYVTGLLIEQVCQEIVAEQLALFRTHALIKATTKDYIREAQIRLILQPVINRLLLLFQGKPNLEAHLTYLLHLQQETAPLEPGYIGGNILNLLRHLGSNLTGYDFSRLTLWQADLRELNLQETNFADANLAKCTFTETFGAIHAVTFNADGTRLAVGDSNGEIHLYQIPDVKRLLTCQRHAGWVTSVAFSPNGKILASSSTDYTIKLWDTSTGQCLRVLEDHTNEVWSIAFSQDNHTLASGSDDCTVKLWDICTGRCVKTFREHAGWVLSVSFARQCCSSSKAICLLSGSDDQTIKLWNTSTGECLQSFQEHQGGIRSLALSCDGQILASGSDDYTIRLWNMKTGQPLKVLQGHCNRVFSVAFSPCGEVLASGGHDQTVKLWSVETGECIKTLHGHSSWVFSVAFNPDGTLLATGGHDQTVKLWGSHTGQCMKTLQGSMNQILTVVLSPDGECLVSGSRDRTVRLWDMATGTCVEVLRGHTNWVNSVVFNPDGTMLASGSGDRTVKLWDIRSRQMLKTLEGHRAAIMSVALSPDGQTVASGSEDHTIKLWDVRIAQLLNTLHEHQAAVWSVAFAAQGAILVSGSWDQTIKLWDVKTGTCLKTLEGHTSWIWAIAVSPDGTTVASASPDQTIRLWNVHTGRCLQVLQLDTNWLKAIAFSPDGRVIASTNHDSTVKLWDIGTGCCLRTLQGHTNLVWSVAFSTVQPMLVSGGDDETIKLWDLESGKCLNSMKTSKLYESMNVAGVKGLTETTIATLMSLGAISN